MHSKFFLNIFTIISTTLLICSVLINSRYYNFEIDNWDTGFHNEMPDSIYNTSKDSIYVFIREYKLIDSNNDGMPDHSTLTREVEAFRKKNGSKSAKLMSNGPKMGFDLANLRTGKLPRKKRTEVVYRVFGKRNASSMEFNIVKWNMGTDHKYDDVRIKFFPSKKYYDLIFTYEGGLDKTSKFQPEREHINGHICDPLEQCK